MKNILSSLCFLFVLGCTPKDLPTILEMDSTHVLLNVSHMTTRAELDDIVKKLSAEEITMSYEGSEFFENGHLRRLMLTVATPEGNSGRTTADIVTLQYRYFGFKYEKGEKGSFSIGEVR